MNGTNNGMLWLAFGLYTLSLLFALWRLAAGKPYNRFAKLIVLFPGFVVHTWYLWQRGLSMGRCPVSGLFETFTFIAWCLVALHLLVTMLVRINYLTVFYMPMVLVIQLAGLIIPKGSSGFAEWKRMSWLGFHASVITLGYAAFGLAAAVGLMYLLQEKQLRTRRLGPSFMLLPSIFRLDVVQTWLVLAGFCLLTTGLIFGFAGLFVIQHRLFPLDIKLLWSLAVWGIYFSWLIGHYRWKISGRSLAWLSVTGCGFVLTTFWLSNYFSSFHHY